MTGMANAPVLPVPVWAQPIRSWPSRIGPIAWAWMGVGVAQPAAAIASSMTGVSFRSVNERTINVDSLSGVSCVGVWW